MSPDQETRHHAFRGSQRLCRGLDRIGVELTSAQQEALGAYLSELQRWASQVNLTGLKTEEAIIREGFLRSFAYRAAFEPAPSMKVIDVGSGAGFPGLVLKIGWPEIDMLLLEPRRRRATFLRSIIRQLALTGVRCLQARAEELYGKAEHQRGYALAVARAVGPVLDMAHLIEPLLKPGGRLILQAGLRTLDSLPSARPALTALGMRSEVLELPAPETGFPPTRLLILDKSPSRP